MENGFKDKTGKRLGAEELDHLADLADAGYSNQQIADAICEKFDRESVDPTTVWRHRRKLPAPQQEDAPWQWERMEEYGLPWEASRVIMDCAALWAECEAAESYPRPFTVRLAKWVHRVSCAYADAPRYVLLQWAEDYARAEAARTKLGKDIDTSAITEYLTFLPDEDQERYARYAHLVHRGVLQGQTLGRDPRPGLKLDAELDPSDPAAPQRLQEYEDTQAQVESEQQERGPRRRAEYDRRLDIAEANWEKLGRPEALTPGLMAQMLPAETHLSMLDFAIMPVQDFYLEAEETHGGDDE